MSLTILSIAWPFAPVGPAAVGGAEHVLAELDCALVRAGHTSLVVACEGSSSAGKLFTAPLPPGRLDEADQYGCARHYQQAIDAALSSRAVDLIHMHGLDFHRYRLPEEVPVLVTLHLPPGWYPPSMWANIGPNMQLQCVSRSQRQACPAESGDLPVVENGVELPELDSIEPVSNPRFGGDFALALGRVCPDKNLHAAIRAGKLAGMRVLIGGRVFPYRAHENYYRREIVPLLRDGNFFLGPLVPDRRNQLLHAAKCLLLPTLAPETSSLVAMEAFAVGTPVIAWPSGAIPEIVEDGVTGFLVESVEAMADAIRRVDQLDRRACRAVAESRFSRERMIRDYFGLYEKCIRRSAASYRSLHAA